MKSDKLEFLKVVCLVVIAVSLAIIAWNTVNQVTELQEIRESLDRIVSRIREINQ